MAGERTPDTTPQSKGGSSDDDISLREHLQRQLDLTVSMFNRRLEEQSIFFDNRMAEMDLRYQQRFDAQQVALKDALASAEKAVTAALTAADRAVAKAENAAEKRFGAVNEFRGTLSDQARELMPRNEAAARFAAQDQIIATLTKQIDRAEGAKSGVTDMRAWIAVGITLIVAAVTVVGFIFANSSNGG